MSLINIKLKIRRMLDFILTLIFFGNIKLLLSNVGAEGLSSYAENEFLFDCAAFGAGEGLVVEIGSYKGRSTITLASALKSKGRGKVYAIDPQTDAKIKKLFFENIKNSGLDDCMIIDHRNSQDAVKDFKEKIRFIFIDGSHLYEDAKNDILMWKKFLTDGAILAMHDCYPPGHQFHVPDVCRAAKEYIIDSRDFVVEGYIDSILFASYKSSLKQSIFDRYRRFHTIRRYFKNLADKSFLSIPEGKG